MNWSKSGAVMQPCRTPFLSERAVEEPLSCLTVFPSGMSENVKVSEWINNVYSIKIHLRSVLLRLQLPRMHNEIRLFIGAFHPQIPARWPVCQDRSFQPRWCGGKINISWIQKVFVSSSLRREPLNTKGPVYSSLYTLCWVFSVRTVTPRFAKSLRVLISPWWKNTGQRAVRHQCMFKRLPQWTRGCRTARLDRISASPQRAAG